MTKTLHFGSHIFFENEEGIDNIGVTLQTSFDVLVGKINKLLGKDNKIGHDKWNNREILKFIFLFLSEFQRQFLQIFSKILLRYWTLFFDFFVWKNQLFFLAISFLNFLQNYAFRLSSKHRISIELLPANGLYLNM